MFFNPGTFKIVVFCVCANTIVLNVPELFCGRNTGVEDDDNDVVRLELLRLLGGQTGRQGLLRGSAVLLWVQHLYGRI